MPDAELSIDSVWAYFNRTDLFFQGIQGGFPDKAFKKAYVLMNRILRRRCKVVVSERIVEYPLVFQHLPSQPQNILDFGCVEGTLPIQLCSLGHSVTGLDLRPYPFTHKKFRFIRADILSWSPPPGQFDLAIAVSTVEHVGLVITMTPFRKKETQ